MYLGSDEFANEIPFVDDILQPFQFEPIFTAIEIEAVAFLKHDLGQRFLIFSSRM